MRYNNTLMNPKLKKLILISVIFVLISLIVPLQTARALVGDKVQTTEPVPFSCKNEAYLFNGGITHFYQLNLVSGDYTDDHTFSPYLINATGYNVTDNMIWGWDRFNNAVVRIDSTYTVDTYTILGLPDHNYNTGDVSQNGVLFLKGIDINEIFMVDVNPSSPTYKTFLGSLPMADIRLADWAFNPKDGFLYGANKGLTPHLYRINPTTGATTDLGEISGFHDGEKVFGAVFFDSSGAFFLSNNNNGHIYRLADGHLGNLLTRDFSFGPASKFNDGARCANAAIPLDLGDAPDSYKTTLLSDGPRHALNTNLKLGPGVDQETTIIPPLNGRRDSFDDGVSWPDNPKTSAKTFSVKVIVQNDIGSVANLIGWIDFDRNGTFDVDEKTSMIIPIHPNGDPVNYMLTWPIIPRDIKAAHSYARFRLTTDSIASIGPGGGASDGEVEDYTIYIDLDQKFLLPYTGFAENRITTLPAQPLDIRYSNLGDLWIEIPSINVQYAIVGIPPSNEGWDVRWLTNQVGYLEGTAFPTHPGNTAITAHNYLPNGLPGPFVDLNQLSYGDQIIVHAWGHEYVYVVQRAQYVRPTNLNILESEDYDVLTLVTCYQYDEALDTYRYRLAVRAVLVSILQDN